MKTICPKCKGRKIVPDSNKLSFSERIDKKNEILKYVSITRKNNSK